MADRQATQQRFAGDRAVTLAQVPAPDGHPGAGEPRPVLVVGVDRGPAGDPALRAAAELGARLGARLRVVHAVDLADHPVDPDADGWETVAHRVLAAERHRVAQVLAGYEGGWTFDAVPGDPADVLAEVARAAGALAVVVAARAGGWRHRLERLVSPSVAHRLVACAGRPVLVVPAPEHDAG